MPGLSFLPHSVELDFVPEALQSDAASLLCATYNIMPEISGLQQVNMTLAELRDISFVDVASEDVMAPLNKPIALIETTDGYRFELHQHPSLDRVIAYRV